MIGTPAGVTVDAMLRVLILALLLVGCSRAAETPATSSPDEDRQLNQAAAELDVNSSGNLAP